jgi:hypothetical protein
MAKRHLEVVPPAVLISVQRCQAIVLLPMSDRSRARRHSSEQEQDVS